MSKVRKNEDEPSVEIDGRMITEREMHRMYVQKNMTANAPFIRDMIHTHWRQWEDQLLSVATDSFGLIKCQGALTALKELLEFVDRNVKEPGAIPAVGANG